MARAIELEVGRDRWTIHVDDNAYRSARHAAPVAPLDPHDAVRQALERPLRFEPLRRALTADDHVAVVADERLPHLAALLTGVLEHLTDAGVSPEAVTLLTAPPATRQGWVDDLPEAFQDVHVEIHDPHDRNKLAYLASTKRGRRVYLNRTLVDSDQVVVLTGRGYDPVIGYSGCEQAIFPTFSDHATRIEFAAKVPSGAGDGPLASLRDEAVETIWLLGTPFMLQVIEDGGDRIRAVLGGLADTSADGQRLLDERWRIELPEPVATVVVPLGGDPTRHDFPELARAAASGAAAVRPDGNVVLLTQADALSEESVGLLARADEPESAVRTLSAKRPEGWWLACQWAGAARKAHIYLASRLDPDRVEALFATPLENERQLQRLVDSGESCLVLPDAHRMHLVAGRPQAARSGSAAR